MAAEHMPAGTLRHVEQRALKVIEDTIKAGREVYEVPTWRGRVAAWPSSSGGPTLTPHSSISSTATPCGDSRPSDTSRSTPHTRT
jgi:hypothetical protein